MNHYWKRQHGDMSQPTGNSRSLKHLWVSAGLAVVLLGATARLAAAQEELPIRRGASLTDNIMTITGTAEVKVAPDAGRVRLGVQVQAPTAAEASSQEATTMSSVVDAVRKAGVDEKDIQTSELNLEPIYDQRQNEAPRLTGFRISNVVQVDIRNMANLGKVLDASLASGANRVDSISFYKQDDSVQRAQALRQAAQAAAEKARNLAAALGITLNGIASVTEGVAQSEPIPWAGRGMAMSAMASTPVMAGQLSLSATVTVQYHIKNP